MQVRSTIVSYVIHRTRDASNPSSNRIEPMTINRLSLPTFYALIAGLILTCAFPLRAEDLVSATIDGSGPGWQALTEADFRNINCAKDTWSWKDGITYCTGKPTGVIATKVAYTNFEMVAEWRHMKYAGNSGIFVWASASSLKKLESGKGSLPDGIEVQVLDLGYEEQWKKNHKGVASDWFTSHGDVFPVRAKMTPFPPVAPNGTRSFPSKRLSKDLKEWNHYYIRCINGEVRLWVNGEEVSGGNNCDPKTGYICLESEGSPIEFKNLNVRKLP